jgi:hypothetical protein
MFVDDEQINSTQSLPKVWIEVVFHAIVCSALLSMIEPASKVYGDLGPLITVLVVVSIKQLLLTISPFVTFNVGIKLIMPSMIDII